MRKDPRVKVSARRTARLRCAVCHGDASPPELSLCAGCATRCHADCVELARGCPSLACVHGRVRPLVRPVPTPEGRRVEALRALEARLAGFEEARRVEVREAQREPVLLRDPVQLLLLGGLGVGALVALALLALLVWVIRQA